MTPAGPEYELYAIRYATRAGQRDENFMGGDPHHGPMPMDYFIWVAVGPDGAVVIDTGFNAQVASKRHRDYLRCPIDSLGLLGIRAEDVSDVIVTHLHYDHAGNFDRFANATFHLQEREMHYATGRYMRYSRLADSFEVDDVCTVVRLNYARRVTFYGGDGNLRPGISLHAAGGHSDGLQFVTVNTRRGRVVLASDVSHFYENLDSMRPYPRAFHVGDMLEGFDKLNAVAPTPDHIIPGHDPEVMERYDPPEESLRGIVVRLDQAPRIQLPGDFAGGARMPSRAAE